MATRTLRLIIFVATFCALWVPGYAFAKFCEDDVLPIDERYKKLQQNGQSEKENSVAYTKLLNETFTPYLQALESATYRVPIKSFRDAAKILAQKLDEVPSPYRFVKGDTFEFNARFDALFNTGAIGNGYLIAPYTKFNRTAMRKLMIATMVMAEMQTATNELYVSQSKLGDSENLRDDRTYAENDMDTQMYLSYHAVLQSVAALTADPVPNWLPETMMKNVLKPQGTCPSLVVMHSLMLPPALLGANGNHWYRKNPVEDVGQRLMVTSDFRSFIKHHRDKYAERQLKRYEFMHGCPVGHTRPNDLYSGLQSFLNAILWVYEAIEWDI